MPFSQKAPLSKQVKPVTAASSPQKTAETDANLPTAKMVHQFYQDHYFSLVLLFFGLLILTGVTLFWAFYEKSIHHPPEYFPTTANSNLVASISLDKPNLSSAALLQWTVEAMTSSYSFNFVNYKKSLQEARMYFTQAGYMNYLNELRNLNVISLVTDRKFVLSSAPTSAPILLKEKVIDGLYTWQVQLPMVVVYHSAKDELRQYLILTMLIIRVPTSESPKGVSIAGLIVRETKRN